MARDTITVTPVNAALAVLTDADGHALTDENGDPLTDSTGFVVTPAPARPTLTVTPA